MKKSIEWGKKVFKSAILETDEISSIQQSYQDNDSLLSLLKHVVFILFTFLACRLEQLTRGVISAGCYPVWAKQSYFGRKVPNRFFLVDSAFDKTNRNGTVSLITFPFSLFSQGLRNTTNMLHVFVQKAKVGNLALNPNAFLVFW